MADRMRLKNSEIEAYYYRIALPEDKRLFAVASLPDEDKLEYLELLKKHHLITIPFENLTLHYSWHRVIDVNPRQLFNKIVAHNHGRGGYCMEVNTLFHTLLLSLGYDVYMAGARVYSPEPKAYGGFSHCVNIIRIGRMQYLVDVGFGANGPSFATPMEPEKEHVHIEPARMRLVREPIAQNVNQDCKVWIYQHKVNAEGNWVPMYCFVDFEFTLEDIRGINLGPSTMVTSWFTQKIVVTRFTTKQEMQGTAGLRSAEKAFGSSDEIDGAVIIDHNKLKWRRGGQIVLKKTLENDQERIDALQQYFGFLLAVEDREAIRGTKGEIARRTTPISITGSLKRQKYRSNSYESD